MCDAESYSTQSQILFGLKKSFSSAQMLHIRQTETTYIKWDKNKSWVIQIQVDTRRQRKIYIPLDEHIHYVLQTSTNKNK